MTNPNATIRDQIRALYYSGNPELKQKALAVEKTLTAQGQDIGSLVAEEVLNAFITQDAAMLKLKARVIKVAHLDDACLIQGPTGTGKSIIAKALHGSRTGKFLQLNCTSLTDDLIASELFGHIKGSFTGAIVDKIGKLQAAAGGTLFLDEIGDMPMSMQTKLLKAIEEKVITRVGDNEEIKISCRIIGATNQSLDCLRNDLYWRLSTFTFTISSLDTRLQDVKLIAQSIDAKFPVEEWLLRNGEEALKGNVRELITAIKRWKVYGELE